MTIDFVLPWVDPSDVEWQQSKAHFSGSKNVDTSNSDARYRDLKTLKYVLRSIETNCPWYNRIYLITAGHHPSWLDLSSEKLHLVRHGELYFEHSHLPVFNSSSIEMNLPNLKGVAEKFVYLNDDTIILKSTPKERFFQNGLPVDFLAHGWLPRNALFHRLRPFDAWVFSLINNLELVNREVNLQNIDAKFLYAPTYSLKNKLSNYLMRNVYRKAFWIEHWHHPQPYRRDCLEEVASLFFKEMMNCSVNKFRARSDLTQYLYRYWHLLNGRFTPIRYNDALEQSNITSLTCLKKMLSDIREKDLRFACFNDSPSLSSEEFHSVKSTLNQFLEEYFPEKASFEL